MADNNVMQAAVQGGSGFLGQLIQGWQSKKNIKRTLEANKQLAKYQYSMDLDMWNRQNEYNTPAAQMQRYKDAGLNENLIYGQGTPGNAMNAPSYPSVQADYMQQKPLISELPNVIGMYQDFALKQAQISNIAANTKATEARTVTEGFRSIVQALMPNKIKAETLKTSRDSNLSLLKQSTEANRTVQIQLANELARALQPDLIQYQKMKNTAIGTDNQKRMEDLLFAKYRNAWIKMGVTTSDNFIIRAFSRMLQGLDLDGVIKGMGPID